MKAIADSLWLATPDQIVHLVRSVALGITGAILGSVLVAAILFRVRR